MNPTSETSLKKNIKRSNSICIAQLDLCYTSTLSENSYKPILFFLFNYFKY